MDIVKEPNLDWLGYKWYFIGASVALMIVSVFLLLTRGLNLGVDFTGGTLVYVKFKKEPELDRIRRVLGEAELKAEGVTRFDDLAKNEVQIRMARIERDEADDLTEQSEAVLRALHSEFDPQESGSDKLDLNNVTKTELASRLASKNPLPAPDGQTAPDYRALAASIVDARTDLGGVFNDWSQLDSLNLAEAIQRFLADNTYLGSFNLISIESVGPKVGRELRDRARSAILLSLLGMLVYIAVRFQPINGVAAIMALFHDVLITLGCFAVSQKEISLTVVAALLTLVGYSINDTIVVFDRMRENMKKTATRAGAQDLTGIINSSINQTLNRTILTSGMTFLAVFALYWLGGQALNGFSFALVVGIIFGTYSSISIASPIVLWWQNISGRKKARA